LSFTDAIINHDSDVINIAGVPGAGKTTEVINLAHRQSSKTFLYLSFGKENTANARRRMPNNVCCMSFHSFAYKQMGVSKARVVSHLGFSHYKSSLNSIGLSIQSPALLECISLLNELFCMSGVPLNQVSTLLGNPSFPNLNKRDLSVALNAFIRLWNACWEDGSTLPITHDMYFKAYALSCKPIEYDYLVIDECQDLNSAMFELCLRLITISPNLIMVRLGDPCQQLFGFRGSSEQFAMYGFDLTLSATHRFGKTLCNLTNDFMSYQTVPHYTKIQSNSDHTQVSNYIGFNAILSHIENGRKQTVIAKYNISLWHILKELALKGVKCSILGGVNKNEFNFLKQLYHVYCTGDKGAHGRLKGMTFERLKMKASINRDQEMLLSCKFIESIHDVGAQAFNVIENQLTDMKDADVMLTTVHQAKGLEFKHLVMMDDFDCARSGSHFLRLPKEEAYLIYTAMTRAKESISLPKSWGDVV
tara:strand:+ start:1613 stop:3040 length:1428 start_codon:yes stop_codon:yes gene_type:complete